MLKNFIKKIDKKFKFDFDVDLASDFNIDDYTVSQFLKVFGNFKRFEDTFDSNDSKNLAIENITKVFASDTFKQFGDWFVKTMGSNILKHGDKDSFEKFQAVILIHWCLFYKEMERISDLKKVEDIKEEEFNKW